MSKEESLESFEKKRKDLQEKLIRLEVERETAEKTRNSLIKELEEKGLNYSSTTAEEMEKEKEVLVEEVQSLLSEIEEMLK